MKSRTSRASKAIVGLVAVLCSPVVAQRMRRSLMTVTRTRGLTGVTNGSPWFGRLNGVARLIQGSQRWTETIPLARVNSQFEPAVSLRRIEV